MIFTKKILLKSKLSVDELNMIIKEHISKPTIFTKLFSGNRKRFQGQVGTESFKLNINHWKSNSVSPIIFGKILETKSQNQIRIKYQVPIFGLIFTFIISLAFVISSFAFGDKIIYELLIPGVGFLIIMRIGFDLMCNMATEILEKELKAKKIKNNNA